MGTPKSLLPIQGISLLRHLSEIAIASICDTVMVVLGANAQQIYPEISDLPLQTIENQDWQAGMGTSISSGLATLLKRELALNAILILVCDQPFVCIDLIDRIVQVYRSGSSPIVATSYLNTVGVPALFSDRHFPELLQLNADTGARQIIQRHLHETHIIAFPEGAIDLDTPNDYQAFLELGMRGANNSSLRKY
jgi:molybdenum cofactor cytidylyltransferase